MSYARPGMVVLCGEGDETSNGQTAGKAFGDIEEEGPGSWRR